MKHKKSVRSLEWASIFAAVGLGVGIGVIYFAARDRHETVSPPDVKTFPIKDGAISAVTGGNPEDMNAMPIVEDSEAVA